MESNRIKRGTCQTARSTRSYPQGTVGYETTIHYGRAVPVDLIGTGTLFIKQASPSEPQRLQPAKAREYDQTRPEILAIASVRVKPSSEPGPSNWLD